MATTFDAILRIGARVEGAADVRALSAAMRQVADETRQVAALERAQLALSRTLIENQQAAARTEKERAAFASQRAQISLRAAETEYAATTKQLAAQKELAAAQVKIAADRVRAADAAMKQALVVTNAMRSEKAAAEQGLQIEIQKARAQYQSINNLKQIAGLEKQATVAALNGVEAANRRAQATRLAGGAMASLRNIAIGVATTLGVGFTGLTIASKNIIDMADSLDELAQRSGSSVDTLSQLGMAAQMSGSSVEETSKGVTKLARNMAEIAAGGGDAAKAALDALGVSAFDTAGKLRIPSDVMLDIADGLQKVEDPALRVKLTMDLLGRGSASLVPALSQGSEAIQKLNTGVSGDFARKAGAYNDQLDVLRATAIRLGASVLDALLPAMVRGATYTKVMIDQASGWVTANKSAIVDMISGITGAIKTLIPIAGALATYATVQWFASLAKLATGFNLVRTAAQLATLAQAAFMSITPAGAAAMLAGIVAASFAYRKLKDDMDALDKKAQETSKTGEGFGAALKAAGLEADEILASLQGQGQALNGTKTAAEQLAATKERQAAIEKEITDRMNLQYDQVVRINEAATARINERRDAAQNILNVEQAQIGVARAILEQKQSLAQTEAERKEIAQQIADLEYRSAQVNYNAIIAQINAERELERIRVINAENEYRRATESYNIAQQYGKITADLTMAREQARSKLITTAVENRAFDASVKARTQVANLNLQASGINAGYDPETAAAMAGGSTTQASGGKITVKQNADGSFNISNQVSGFAAGGHVRGPTLAWVGEGGEGESIVPDSKRMGFARNVLAGVTGAAAIPKFATGGYIQPRDITTGGRRAGQDITTGGRGGNWLQNNQVSTFKQGTKVVNGVTYTFDPFGTLRLREAELRLAEANRGVGRGYGLDEFDKWKVLSDFGGSISPWGGVRLPAPADPWFVRDKDRVAANKAEREKRRAEYEARKASRADTAYGPTTYAGYGQSVGVGVAGQGGGSIGFPIGGTEFNGTISIQPKMTPMPDGQLWAPKSEMERMAYEVANQAISKNNAEQRQPSARRRRGR
jgi:hypothetical protein